MCLLVSLFVRLWVEMYRNSCLPHLVMSASSWGCELKYVVYRTASDKESQPLREAVSWNYADTTSDLFEKLSASSWGCELKCWENCCRYGNMGVSLFVRLWVEIPENTPSAMENNVSLFVRLWVEITLVPTQLNYLHRQPLREAVSWNVIKDIWCITS